MQKLHKDILSKEIHAGDFIVYTPVSSGLRVGMVIVAVADGWTGSYSYIHRKVKVVTLDYRNPLVAIKSPSAPEIIRVMVTNDIPQAQKDVLIERARELGYNE